MSATNLILKYTVPFNRQLLNKIIKDSSCVPSLLIHEATQVDSNQFVTRTKQSIYTSLRTYKKPYQLLLYINHIDRLTDNLQQILNHRDGLVSSQNLSTILKPSLHYALSQFYSLNEEKVKSEVDFETKLTLSFFLNQEGEELQCEIHVTQLNKHNTKSCLVDLFGNPRENPTVKHSDWARDRQTLEANKSVGSNEVLLIDSNHQVYEGLTSNFFVLAHHDGQLVLKTAPLDKVLTGTVQKYVLEAAAKLNIQVVFEFPSLEEKQKSKWEAAFLTSTSRLILPIGKFNHRDLDGVTTKFEVKTDHPTLLSLMDMLDQMILEACVVV